MYLSIFKPLQMNLYRLRETWTELGNKDPLWAVLSSPGTRGGKWDIDTFFATGRKDVAEVLDTLAKAGVSLSGGRALDFGCGVGRLTQALAHEFREAVGVDIASSMIERAREFLGPHLRCTFLLNTTDDLEQLSDGTFDFVYSHIVFQHMEPRFALKYVTEFGRLLRPGGVAVFQVLLPANSYAMRNWVKRTFPSVFAIVHRAVRPSEPAIELYGIPERDLAATLKNAGLTIIKRVDDPNGGRGTRGMVYYTQKMT